MVEGAPRAVEGFTDVEGIEGLLLGDQYIIFLLLHCLLLLVLFLMFFLYCDHSDRCRQ